jgi:hypothetical protein
VDATATLLWSVLMVAPATLLCSVLIVALARSDPLPLLLWNAGSAPAVTPE